MGNENKILQLLYTHTVYENYKRKEKILWNVYRVIDIMCVELKQTNKWNF